MSESHFALRGDHITLGDLLKVVGWVGSGGQAKLLIAEGRVKVDGQPETRRGRKLRAGQQVSMDGRELRIEGAPAAGEASAAPAAE